LLCAGAFGAMSVSELGKASNLDRSQASRATDILEGRGLLIKRSSASDGRGVEVALTSEGAALYKRALVISRESNGDILAVLSKAERKALTDAFDKLVAAVSDLSVGES
jgi:DNA-binding MarR family transcriptional regulator